MFVLIVVNDFLRIQDEDLRWVLGEERGASASAYELRQILAVRIDHARPASYEQGKNESAAIDGGKRVDLRRPGNLLECRYARNIEHGYTRDDCLPDRLPECFIRLNHLLVVSGG